MSEKDILEEALRQLSWFTGGKTKKIAISKHGGEVSVQVILGKEKHNFSIEIKNELRQATVAVILAKISKYKDSSLLVSKYIPQPIKDQLKEQGINYLEVAGNCYINAGGLFIYINDRPVTSSRQTEAGKLWKQTGLKFLFAVISNPALLQEPYRVIADTANIALGNIGPFLEELQKAGHVTKTDGKCILTNKESLIHRWIELYPVVLRPRLQKGRFRFLNPSMQTDWKGVGMDNSYWGGEPAGELYTNFLNPELFTIYSSQPVNELIKEIKIVPDKTGKIELVQQFWNNKLWDNYKFVPHAVPPLLAFADLMESSSSRNWEVAERIQKEYLND